MKTVVLILLIMLCCRRLSAQSNVGSTIVEGGRALIELIKVIKMPKRKAADKPVEVSSKKELSSENCYLKQQSDLCFLNSTDQSLVISIYRRSGDSYEESPFTMKVISRKEECWFALKAGIYKYKIEIDRGLMNLLLREGEFKLEACENMLREIKE